MENQAARPWAWAKRKHSLTDQQNIDLLRHGRVIDNTWEEQAFAEDTLGPLGGCVWPPRSYSCSFCRREFRSAQALGGHMNVHRRDRARLKQSMPSDLPPEITYQHNTSTINSIPLQQNHMSSPLKITSVGGTRNSSTNTNSISQIPQFSSQVCPIVYNPNPKSDRLDPNQNLLTPPLCHDNIFHNNDIQNFPHHSSISSTSVMLQEKSMKCSNDRSLNPPPQIYSWSKLGSSTDRYYSITNNIQKDPLKDEQKVSSTIVESGGSCTARPSKSSYHHLHQHGKADLSVSLNLVLCRSCPPTLSGSYNDGKGDDCDLVMMGSCKRIKVSDVDDEDADHAHQTVSPCPVEELDLELRIGVGPHKVTY